MSCPDWKILAAWRDDPRAEEPAGWQDALEHFDRGCQGCRRAALAADPTLVFRRLGRPAVTSAMTAAPTPAQEISDASEVASMRQAVAAMRAASRVEAVERRGRHGAISGWRNWSVAAVLTLAVLTLPAERFRSHLDSRDPRPGSLQGDFQEAALREMAVPLPATSVDDLPTVDGVNRPGARVYHMDGEGLSVTMIVDESLDV